MAPCFSRDFLKQMLPSFNENRTGWGLDLYWPTKIADWTRIAIIDAVTVRHTRPVGGPNYLASGGKDPRQELRELLGKYGVTPQQPFVRGAIDKAERRLSMDDLTARELIDNIVIGYLPEFSKHADLLMQLVRPNLDWLCVRAFGGAAALAALKAS
jgi:hypothetical protein